MVAVLKNEERSIGEHRYRVTQLPSGKGRRLLTRIFKVVGPSLATLATEADDVRSLGDMPMKSIGEALGKFAELVTEEDLDHVCSVLAESTELRTADGQGWLRLDREFEFHFAGAYDQMFKWLAFALEVNYGSFFSGARAGALASALRKTA